VGARELPVPGARCSSFVDHDQLLFMSMFQYMIGNTDYSILTCTKRESCSTT